MIYLQLDLSKKREIQNKLMKYMQSKINHDKKIDELIDWKNSAEILAWLDSLWLTEAAIVSHGGVCSKTKNYVVGDFENFKNSF